jgi:hypothetical protein
VWTSSALRAPTACPATTAAAASLPVITVELAGAPRDLMSTTRRTVYVQGDGHTLVRSTRRHGYVIGREPRGARLCQWSRSGAANPHQTRCVLRLTTVYSHCHQTRQTHHFHFFSKTQLGVLRRSIEPLSPQLLVVFGRNGLPCGRSQPCSFKVGAALLLIERGTSGSGHLSARQF